MKKPFFFALAAIAQFFILADSIAAEPGSIATGPLGFVRVTAYAGESTPIGISMLNRVTGGGTIAAVNGSNIVLNYELSSGVVPSYLEITDEDSPFVGDRLDVVSVAGLTVTVDTSGSSFSTIQGALPNDLIGATLVHREHVTLGQLEDWIPAGSGFVGSRFPQSADKIHFYRNDGLIVSHYSNTGVWARSGVADASDTVIGPGEGILFHRYFSADDLTFTVPGGVRANDFRQNLNKGMNLVATGYPFDVSFVERGFVEANGFKASRFGNRADRILPIDSSGGLTTYYLRSGSNWGVPDFVFNGISAVYVFKQNSDFEFYSPKPY